MEVKQLTKEQIDMVQMFADGLTRQQVAKKVELSPRTVEEHCDKIRAVLGCKTIVGVVVYCFREKLIK